MVELLRAKVLRSPHGFPTRAGGTSAGPYESLNTSRTVGDDGARVDENLRRLAEALGAWPEQLITVQQVHGTTVLEAQQGARGTLGEADALITSAPGLVVGVRTADCLPLLIEDRRTSAVAAVHAGWRGVIGEIVVRAIERLVAKGARVEDLAVACGPSIQACCFEVDGELPERFSKAFGADVVRAVPGKAKVHLDLGAAVRRSLERAGVPPGQIELLPHCTRCDARFFSHRRDQGVTGRHLSLIRCEPGNSATAL